MKRKASQLTMAISAGLLMITLLGGTTAFGITKAFSDYRKKNALTEMTLMTEKRAEDLRSFVNNAAQTVQHFSRAEEIKELLDDPNNKELAGKVQKYTEDFSQVTENLEEIYVGDYSSCCLAHSYSWCVGMKARNDKTALMKLQDSLLSAGDGVYNAGITLSPAADHYILSVYKPVYNDSRTPVGYCGLCLYTQPLEEQNTPHIQGVENASYNLINVKDARYIADTDTAMAGKAVENEELLTLCRELAETDDSVQGTLEYQDLTGSYIASYTYLPEYGWLLMLDAGIRC